MPAKKQSDLELLNKNKLNQDIEESQDDEAILAKESSVAEVGEDLPDNNPLLDQVNDQSLLGVDSNQEEQVSITDDKQEDDLLQETGHAQNIEQQNNNDSNKQAAWMYMLDQQKKPLGNKQVLNNIDIVSSLLRDGWSDNALKLLENPIVAEKIASSMPQVQEVKDIGNVSRKNSDYVKEIMERADKFNKMSLSEKADLNDYYADISREGTANFYSYPFRAFSSIVKNTAYDAFVVNANSITNENGVKFNDMTFEEKRAFIEEIEERGYTKGFEILFGRTLTGTYGKNSHHPADTILLAVGDIVLGTLQGANALLINDQAANEYVRKHENPDFVSIGEKIDLKLVEHRDALYRNASYYKGIDKLLEKFGEGLDQGLDQMGEDPLAAVYLSIYGIPSYYAAGRVQATRPVGFIGDKVSKVFGDGKVGNYLSTTTKSTTGTIIANNANNRLGYLSDGLKKNNNDRKKAYKYQDEKQWENVDDTALFGAFPDIKSGATKVRRFLSSSTNRYVNIVLKPLLMNMLESGSDNIDKQAKENSLKKSRVFQNIFDAPITKRSPETAKLVFNTVTHEVYIDGQVLTNVLEEHGVDSSFFAEKFLGGVKYLQEAIVTGQNMKAPLGSIAVGLANEGIHYSKIINHLSDSVTSLSANDLKENADSLKTYFQNMPQYINSAAEQISKNKADHDLLFNHYKNSGLDDSTAYNNAWSHRAVADTLTNNFGVSVQPLINNSSVDQDQQSLNKTNRIASNLLGAQQKGFLQKDPKTNLFTINTTSKVNMDAVIKDSSILFLDGYHNVANNDKAPAALVESYKTVCEYFGIDNVNNASPEQLKQLSQQVSYFINEGKAKDPKLTELLSQYQDFALDLYQNTKGSGVKFSKEVSEQLEPLLISRNMVDDVIGSSESLFPLSTEGKLRASDERQKSIRALEANIKQLEKENLTQRQEYYRELEQKSLLKNKEATNDELSAQKQKFNLLQLLGSQKQLELQANVLAVNGYKLNLVKTDMAELAKLQYKEQGYKSIALDMMAKAYSVYNGDYFYNGKAEEMLDGKEITIKQRDLYLVNADKASQDARKAFENKEFDKAIEAKQRERLNYALYSEAVPLLEQSQKMQKVIDQVQAIGNKTRSVLN